MKQPANQTAVPIQHDYLLIFPHVRFKFETRAFFLGVFIGFPLKYIPVSYILVKRIVSFLLV